MLRHVLFDLMLFEHESDRPNSQKRVLVLLEALTLCNQFYLQEHTDTPLIYKSGIKYKLPAQFEKEQVPEVGTVLEYLTKANAPSDVKRAFKTLSNQVGGGETFRDIPRIIENGGGDCDNVACWRTAEIRHHLGVAAKPYITWRDGQTSGSKVYHVVTIWPDGSSEDSSLLLGMGGPERDADRREEERKLGERAGEMLDALRAPPAQAIAGVAQRRAQLVNAVGLLLRGGGRQ